MSASPVSILKGIFFTDLHNKGTALVLALAVWAFAYYNKQETMAIDFQLIFEPEPNAVILEQTVRESTRDQAGREFKGIVRLTLKGQGTRLRDLQQGKESHSFRVSSEGDIRLDREDVWPFGAGIEIEKAEPQVVYVLVEDLVERSRTVSKNEVGYPDSSFRVKEIRVEPAEVTLRGPYSELRDVWVGVDVDVTGLKETTTKKYDLVIKRAKFTTIAGESSREVEVTTVLESNDITQEFTVQLKYAMSAGFRNSVKRPESTLNVILKGPEKELAQVEASIQSGELLAMVEIPQEQELEDEYILIKELRFDPTLPPNVKFIKLNPPGQSFELDVERIDE